MIVFSVSLAVGAGSRAVGCMLCKSLNNKNMPWVPWVPWVIRAHVRTFIIIFIFHILIFFPRARLNTHGTHGTHGISINNNNLKQTKPTACDPAYTASSNNLKKYCSTINKLYFGEGRV